MYKLYFLPNSCSLAINVLLRELKQEFELINKNQVDDFTSINPTGSVPVLAVDNRIWTEGAGIILNLLHKHPNEQFLSSDPKKREQTVIDILFANATIHPAYGKLFNASANLPESKIKDDYLQTLADSVNKLWAQVEERLAHQDYFAGEQMGVTDILLSVYSGWNQYFAVNIKIGAKTQAMINKVRAMPSFKSAVSAEQQTNP